MHRDAGPYLWADAVGEEGDILAKEFLQPSGDHLERHGGDNLALRKECRRRWRLSRAWFRDPSETGPVERVEDGRGRR